MRKAHTRPRKPPATIPKPDPDPVAVLLGQVESDHVRQWLKSLLTRGERTQAPADQGAAERRQEGGRG